MENSPLPLLSLKESLRNLSFPQVWSRPVESKVSSKRPHQPWRLWECAFKPSHFTPLSVASLFFLFLLYWDIVVFFCFVSLFLVLFRFLLKFIHNEMQKSYVYIWLKTNSKGILLVWDWRHLINKACLLLPETDISSSFYTISYSLDNFILLDLSQLLGYS